MNEYVRRLKKVFGVSTMQARALVEAGFDMPRKIKAASDQELLDVRTIGEAALAQLRRY